MPTTARLALPYPSLASSANVPADIQALATALDQAGLWGQGLLAARPAAVGIQGRFYWATDSAQLYINTGTAWVAIGPSGLGNDSITAAMIQANAVGSSEIADDAVDTAAIQALAVTNAKIAALAVDASKIAAALKPSGGAGAGTEALRALGTTAGTALAGDHPASTVPVASFGGTRINGQTYTITAPVAGTYILEWGAGQFNSASQGSGLIITTAKTAGQSSYSDVGGSGGPVVKGGIVCTGGEVITFTVSGSANGSSLDSCWAKLTRTA